MKTQKIEVDEEVYLFLKNNATPFTDTPNSVLRRLLLRKHEDSAKSGSESTAVEAPSFPNGVPKALTEILEVIYLVKKNGLTRIEATRRVAERLGIFPQTVIDKYCRQLDKKAFEIDRLLGDDSLSELQSLLGQRFANHRDVIEHIFSMLR